MHPPKLQLALIIASLAPFVAQGANRRQSFEELTAASDKVVLGTVSLKSSHWGDDSRIYTDVVVSPDVTIKGAEEGAVVIQVLGGEVGDTRMSVHDGPEFPEGQRVVVFLKRNANHFSVVGQAEGSISASSPEASEAVDVAFANVERFYGRRMSGARGLAQSYVSHIGNFGSSATQAAAVQQGCYSTDGAKWATSSATYKIGTTIPATWASSIDASAATWNSAGVPFQLVNDSTSTNELSYADLVAKYGSSYSNTFAVTTTWSSVSTGRISKATIEVNTKWPWSTSGQAQMADVQNILTHEFGHWMRLLDIYSPNTCSDVTMWGSASFGEIKKRTLEQPDIDGFRSLYSAGPTLAAPVLTAPANGATGLSTTATLTWNAVSGATSYDVYFGNTPTPALAITTTATTYQPATLTAGVTYYWRVVAKNSTTTSATSTTFSFTTAPGTVSGPTLLSPANGATGVANRSLFQWTAVPGATTYDVYFGTTATPSLIGSIRATAVTVTGFQSGITYYWKIVARTPSGPASSPVWSFRTK